MEQNKLPIAIVRFIALVRCGLIGLVSMVGAFVPVSMYPAFCEIFLWIFGVSYVCPSGIRNANNFNGLIVFNHPTFYDHFVIMSALKRPVSFVYKEAYFRYNLAFQAILKRLQCIPVSKNGGTTEALKQSLENDREYPIAIAPGSGYVTDKIEDIPPFRTGAFYASNVVLPVVLVYTPYRFCEFQGNILAWIWGRLTGPAVTCTIEVLEPMVRYPGETPEIFKDRVYSRMYLRASTVKHQSSNIQSPRPRWLNMTAVLALFGSCVPMFMYHRFFMEALGTCSVIITSLLYHYTDNIHAKYLDIINNFSIGAIMSSTAIVFYGNPYPLGMASIALLGYVWECKYPFGTHMLNQLQHTLLVHVPVFIGFLSYVFSEHEQKRKFDSH